MSHSWLYLSCSLLLSLAGQGQCYESGAPETACTSMQPGHIGITPQSTSAPYTLSTSANTYNPSDTITVTVTATGSSQPIRGFLIQARRADPNLSQVETIGTFTNPNSMSQTSCSGGAVTHTSANDNPVSTLSFDWTAPSSAQGHIKFRATIATAKETYWLNIESSMVTDPDAGPISAAPTNAPTSTGISVGECGVSKGCMRTPDDCTSCDAIVTWKDTGNGYLDMELGRSGDGWVGVGFSTDLNMGGDSVISCIRHSGNTVVSQSKNSGRVNEAINNHLDGISNVEVGYIGGQVVCRFRRKKHVNGRTSDIYNLNNDYYLFLGTGPATSASNLGKLQHGNIPIKSSNTVSLTSNTAIGGSAVVPALVKAHGCIMVFAWVTTASLGVLMARHYKQHFKGKTLFGKAVWFGLHVPSMLSTTVLTIIAFILIFVHAQGYSDFGNINPNILKAHPILGIVVTILAIVNPVMAIFRPHPGTTKRPLFNWAHWGVGVTARILAVITIFMGLNLPSVKPTVPVAYTWVMVGFVAFYILVEIILEFHKCRRDKKQKESNIELSSPGDHGSPTQAPAREEDELFKTVIFGLIVIGLLAFGLAIVIGIAA